MQTTVIDCCVVDGTRTPHHLHGISLLIDSSQSMSAQTEDIICHVAGGTRDTSTTREFFSKYFAAPQKSHPMSTRKLQLTVECYSLSSFDYISELHSIHSIYEFSMFFCILFSSFFRFVFLFSFIAYRISLIDGTGALVCG